MIIGNKVRKEILKDNPYRSTYVGVFREEIEVDGILRRFVIYVPENVRPSTTGIMVLPKDGESAEEWLFKSNWPELADTDEILEKFIVCFLEAKGFWNLKEPEQDLAYVDAVYNQLKRRNRFCIHEAKFYMVGYGSGGTMAQMAAMDNPAVYAGVAAVCPQDICLSLIEKKGDEWAYDLNGFTDPDHVLQIKKKELCVPVWMISSEDTESMANSSAGSYWRSCAGVCSEPRKIKPDTTEYYRDTAAPWTVNQEKEAFSVWFSQMENAVENYGYLINRRIRSEFFGSRVRMMAEPGGDLRIWKDPVKDLHMDYHYEDVDGWKREFYVYVPERIRNNPKKKVPLVFAMHGYTCSGEIYIHNSEWYKVAEARGFIVVFPSAVPEYLHFEEGSEGNIAARPENTALPGWNVFDVYEPKANEIFFFEHMIESVASAYPVDRTRIYATGHSHGSLMTQVLAIARPNLFAAAAPCSGVMFNDDSEEKIMNRADVQKETKYEIAVWMFGGEKEEWLLAARPQPDNLTGKTIEMWWKRNHLDG